MNSCMSRLRMVPARTQQALAGIIMERMCSSMEKGVFHEHPAPHSWGKPSCVMSPAWDTAKPKQGTQQTLCTMTSQSHGRGIVLVVKGAALLR